jgi:5-dehydro-2-deoxygluconokinase
MDLELLTVGRVSVDLYAEQLGVPIRQVATFRKSVGGTATNVAVAAARLGHRAAVLTKVGDDPFGDYVRWALAETFGVDTRFVGVDPSLRTPLAFAELDPPDDPQIIFYRQPNAPDLNLEPGDVDLEIVRRVPVLWISLGALSAEPSRSTVHQLLAERAGAPPALPPQRERPRSLWGGDATPGAMKAPIGEGAQGYGEAVPAEGSQELPDRGSSLWGEVARPGRGETVLDLDWRPQMWDRASSATGEAGAALRHATLAIGNRAECEIAVGTADPDLAADRLLARGLRGAIVKLGAGGVLVATADGARERVPPYPVDVVCGLGAGDAFGGALCHGLLAGSDLVECARYGNAAGAIVAGRLMCADDMPTLDEIQHVLGAAGSAVVEGERRSTEAEPTGEASEGDASTAEPASSEASGGGVHAERARTRTAGRG